MTIATMPAAHPELDAIRHHYEVGNSFYRLLLGPTMMYSGGYWAADEDLHAAHDEAQLRKIDTFIDLAGAGDARRVLDIGSGWGTMLDRVTRIHGAEQAVGVTLSRTQKEWVDALANPRVAIRVESWEDHRADDPYDAAFCVNALEHFVSASLPAKDRTRRFGTFFEKVHSLLRPGAGFVLHTMTAERQPLNRELLQDLKFLQREEFKDCHIPHLHELTAGVEGLFEVVEIRNERESFSQACRVWLTQLAENRAAAVALEGEEVVARFERYLDIFAYTLEDGYFNNFRIVLTRR
ncbi:class I SAM-dependent methyltransferase [Natronosporangium hydrolyticum]|uniref:Class I SAM-dependent methyltransferase n=1 Tax=Natronosporangium hydrolyticum TaxID=2811111 RepID=A0A895YPW2_9ACTN|nr:class I SAM-dependent methyltransferase [Natronosporangium hydrolyticum]QSB16776.1 class I SAM-dependent methyltransferase [Natronosporangium hydrolyticum]